MGAYVDDYQRENTVHGHTDRWSHLWADTPAELEEFAGGMGIAHQINNPGRPWAYIDVTEAERLEAIWRGAAVVGWREGLEVMRARAAAARNPTPPPPPVEAPPPVSLAAQLEAARAELPKGVFICGPGRGPARWNPVKPRHAWDEPVEHFHQCHHCGLLYRSVQEKRSPRWYRVWEWPDGRTGDTRGGHALPSCPGPAARTTTPKP